MKFRKKPVVIEATQWCAPDGNEQPWPDSFVEAAQTWRLEYGPDSDVVGLRIPTLEGHITASPGDWIIRVGKGEFYPCKPDIFADTYEPADV